MPPPVARNTLIGGRGASRPRGTVFEHVTTLVYGNLFAKFWSDLDQNWPFWLLLQKLTASLTFEKVKLGSTFSKMLNWRSTKMLKQRVNFLNVPDVDLQVNIS